MMFKQLLFGLASSLLTSRALASDPVDPSKEIVYLTDCGEYVYSTMAYYSNAGSSGNGIYPAALATFGWVVGWEGSVMVGTYPDGNQFTSRIAWGSDHLSLGQVAGTGANHYHDFTCYKGDGGYLYTAKEGYSCYGIYYCQ